MQSLHYDVRLRVIRNRVGAFCSDDIRQRWEKISLEQSSLIYRQGQGHAESAYPVVEECVGDGESLLIDHRDRHGSSVKTVDDGQPTQSGILICPNIHGWSKRRKQRSRLARRSCGDLSWLAGHAGKSKATARCSCACWLSNTFALWAKSLLRCWDDIEGILS